MKIAISAFDQLAVPSRATTPRVPLRTFALYKSSIHQKLVAHKNTKKTNLNKLNQQRATCLQISQHGGRVEHWVEQNLTAPDKLKLHAYLMF